MAVLGLLKHICIVFGAYPSNTTSLTFPGDRINEYPSLCSSLLNVDIDTTALDGILSPSWLLDDPDVLDAG